jgi:hypothetical protein
MPGRYCVVPSLAAFGLPESLKVFMLARSCAARRFMRSLTRRLHRYSRHFRWSEVPMRLTALLLLLVGAASASAESLFGRPGKLPLTGGVSQIEGSAGGGLTPWAVIGGLGAGAQHGAAAYATQVWLDDYRLQSQGVLIGLSNTVELSLARQSLDTRQVGALLGLGRGFRLEQDVFGAKFRIAGDAVLEQDRWLPQLAAGFQHKRHLQPAVPLAVGAARPEGTDLYLSATKLYLDYSLLLSGTTRYTEANQLGLLGFGGADSGRELVFEGSAAYLLNRRLAVGVEFRDKPDLLAVAGEDAAWDVFVAWSPLRHLNLTLAAVDLGNVVVARQRGVYLSVQVAL